MKIVRVALVPVIVLAASVSALAQAGSDWNSRLEKAKYSLSDAIEKGMKEAGSGTVIQAELEPDGDDVVYSIDVAQKDQKCNVVLDVASGKVIEKQDEDEDHSDEVAACKVSLATAVANALKKQPGKAVEAELMMKGGKPEIKVKIVVDGKLVMLGVDGASGQVLAAGGKDEQGDEDGMSEEDESFTTDFNHGANDWSSTGVNPWFNLTPGYVLMLEGEEDGEKVKLTITVMDETKRVDGVETRVVEEREECDGEVIEISLNYFAISKRTNDVCYFGEDSREYEDGKEKSRGGSWLAGVNGAKYGVLIPGSPMLGAKYYQEIAPGEAMDRAEVISLDEKLATPGGKFENVLKTLETTPLEPGREFKYYAAGVGIIQDGSLKLVSHGHGKKGNANPGDRRRR